MSDRAMILRKIIAEKDRKSDPKTVSGFEMLKGNSAALRR
jgi:hypothetical protein